MTTRVPSDRAPSPREFLRRRFPELFSDSRPVEKQVLERPLLEYQLDTLTSRSQEHDFEAFARGLAERLICPSLLPHTGPTGGGDSGVDSETIPVADVLALGWYHGIGREAAEERWAFAFSAKRDWRPKLRSDVTKIVKTERGYKRAFFITNQFVRDRDRSDLEDELRRTYGLDVRILDRTWILDNVFKHHLEELAIDALHLPISLRPELQKGPRDAERERELADLDAAIDARLHEGRLGPRLAVDALNAAKVARGLERPQHEIDGRFQRAVELAKRVGSAQQHVEAVYAWAWTTYWWYEDYRRSTTPIRLGSLPVVMPRTGRRLSNKPHGSSSQPSVLSKLPGRLRLHPSRSRPMQLWSRWEWAAEPRAVRLLSSEV